MQDVNVFDDLQQVSLGQVKALEYGRYDINECYFSDGKVRSELSTCATANNEVVVNGKDASRLVADYYGVLQKIIEYTFGGTKELKVVFFNVIGLI
jgi:hypothetical protein